MVLFWQMREFIEQQRGSSFCNQIKSSNIFLDMGTNNGCQSAMKIMQLCLLLSVYPEIYAEFLENSFVDCHRSQSGSAVPFDQELEQGQNKPAKSKGGITGVTRRKNAVCKRNIVKHKKVKYSKFVKTSCLIGEDDEYSLILNFPHHQQNLMESVFLYL